MANFTVSVSDNLAITDTNGFSRLSSVSRLLSENLGVTESINQKGGTPIIQLGGSTQTFHVSWPANTTPVCITTRNGRIKSYDCMNNASAARFIRMYDMVRAPIVQTDLPFWTIGLPANSRAALAFDEGIPWQSCLWAVVVTGAAETNNTAPSADDVQISLTYL